MILLASIPGMLRIGGVYRQVLFGGGVSGHKWVYSGVNRHNEHWFSSQVGTLAGYGDISLKPDKLGNMALDLTDPVGSYHAILYLTERQGLAAATGALWWWSPDHDCWCLETAENRTCFGRIPKFDNPMEALCTAVLSVAGLKDLRPKMKFEADT